MDGLYGEVIGIQKRMSNKKKAGSKMSLKDFHGGSIPSDLRLPTRHQSPSRFNSDRQISTSGGNSISGFDLQRHPKSSVPAFKFYDSVSFLFSHENIGCNFEEDDRKPLDSVSAAHQTIPTTSIRRIHQELELDHVSSVRSSDKQTVSQPPWFLSSSSLARYKQGDASSQEMGGSGLSKTHVISKFSESNAREKVQSMNPSHLLPHSLYSRNSIKSMKASNEVVSPIMKRLGYLVKADGEEDSNSGSTAVGGWNWAAEFSKLNLKPQSQKTSFVMERF